jgi:hypothetical protein
MITTVTPNPSLDRTLHVARFAPGHVNRATDTMVEPSGKGVNVALALHGAGVPVRAVLPVGGSAGHEIAVLLDGFGLEHIAVPIAGAVRSNISLVEADGRSTKVNEPGPDLSAADLAQPLHGTAPAPRRQHRRRRRRIPRRLARRCTRRRDECGRARQRAALRRHRRRARGHPARRTGSAPSGLHSPRRGGDAAQPVTVRDQRRIVLVSMSSWCPSKRTPLRSATATHTSGMHAVAPTPMMVFTPAARAAAIPAGASSNTAQCRGDTDRRCAARR